MAKDGRPVNDASRAEGEIKANQLLIALAPALAGEVERLRNALRAIAETTTEDCFDTLESNGKLGEGWDSVDRIARAALDPGGKEKA